MPLHHAALSFAVFIAALLVQSSPVVFIGALLVQNSPVVFIGALLVQSSSVVFIVALPIQVITLVVPAVLGVPEPSDIIKTMSSDPGGKVLCLDETPWPAVA